MATYLGPEHTEQLLQNTIIENGDSRDYKDLSPGRGVGDRYRFQRGILPYTNKQPVQEVHAFSYPGQDLSIQSTALWSVHSPHGVYSDGHRGQISGNKKGYKNPPVPRQLVGQSQIPYAFPPAVILGKVVEKLQDYPCSIIILIAPGWPNMPWFWYLVEMSSQIPCVCPTYPI